MDSTLIERLRATECDREPFTPDHAKCVCRLANAAADEIERLREALGVIARSGPTILPDAEKMIGEFERMGIPEDFESRYASDCASFYAAERARKALGTT